MIWSGLASARRVAAGGSCDSIACCVSVTAARNISSITRRMSTSGVTLISGRIANPLFMHGWTPVGGSGSASSFAKASDLLPRLGGRIRPARRRTPLRAVRLFLELGAQIERTVEVRRILEHRRHDEPDIAVRGRRQPVEVLDERRVLTVRDAVVSQIAIAEIRRLHAERSAF